MGDGGGDSFRNWGAQEGSLDIRRMLGKSHELADLLRQADDADWFPINDGTDIYAGIILRRKNRLTMVIYFGDPVFVHVEYLPSEFKNFPLIHHLSENREGKRTYFRFNDHAMDHIIRVVRGYVTDTVAYR